MLQDCIWIGTDCRNPAGRFAYFRLDTAIPEGAELTAEISAAARYRLWVNGQPVCSGPCAGDQYVWYGDTVELTPYLCPGVNRFAVQVLCLDPAASVDIGESEGITLRRVIVPDHRHRLAFRAKTAGIDLSTGKADWRVRVDENTSLRLDDVTIFLGSYNEDVDYTRSPASWKTADCSAWPRARCLESVTADNYHPVVGIPKRYEVSPRPIPMLFEREECFIREIMTETGLLQKGSLSIPPHSTFETVLDAGQVKVTYPAFPVRGGAGGRLEITYFEKFTREGQNLRRDDWQQGEIVGVADRVVLSGDSVCYEPFFPRTFRFIRLHVETADEEAVVSLPIFRRTGYPLTEDSRISSSASWVEQLWRMSVETLQNCMLDTYMDCPYYEQLQYIMDTRLQVLFNFSVSRDTSLARKALEDFHRSILPCGLLPGKYPTAYMQIISTFSLYYVFMIWEYYAHTGDRNVLSEYRADCDRILSWFDAHLTQRNLMGHPGFWPFVDWQDAWQQTAGTPAALTEGESTILSLMYAYALDRAADVNEHSGRPGMAEEYRARKQAVCDAVRMLCWDENRQMYREGPSFEQYTQHAQAWAVLCGIGDARCMHAALDGNDVLRVTFATSYEWMRALEQTGLYSHARDALQPWIDLIVLGCKTCPETPGPTRSDNHAWSALPMLELIRGIAGIQQEGIGWKRVRIVPRLLDLPDLKGTAATPEGDIGFDYSAGRFSITLPEGVTGIFCCPDGRKIPLRSGKQVLRG